MNKRINTSFEKSMCTKSPPMLLQHFMNGCGPTPTYPDPIPQTTSTSTPKQSRLPPKNKEIFKGQSW